MKIELLSSHSLNRLIWLADCRLSGHILSFGFGFFDKKIDEPIKEIKGEEIILKIETPLEYIKTDIATIALNGQLKIVEWKRLST